MIRRMSEADLEQLAELEKRCFSECWSYRLLEQGLYSPYDVYYVFEQEGDVFGYANLRVLAGEGEVERIAVLPQYRGKGVGRKLMDAMVRYAVSEGVSALNLEVRESNETAIRLYRSYGFEQIAVRKDYYHNPAEHAVIMRSEVFAGFTT